MKVLASISKHPKIYFFYPQFEVLSDNSLRFIQKDEFRNRGTIMMAETSEEVDKYLERLIMLEVDTTNPLQTYRQENPDSCEFGVRPSDIIHLKSNQIIEVIKLDKTIDQIIANESDRIIEDVSPLNSRIYLEIDDFIYGEFSYINVQNSNGINGIKINACVDAIPQNSIKKYRKKDVEKYIYPARLRAGYYDEPRNFIYSSKVLEEKVKNVEVMDFIDDVSLINLLRKELKNSSKYKLTNEEVTNIKNAISELNNIEFKDSRIKRLNKIIRLTKEKIDFKEDLLSEYFNSREGNIEKINYLKENPEVMINVIKNMDDYDNHRFKLEQELGDIRKQIEVEKQNLERINKEKENVALNEIQKKKTELEELNNNIKIKNKEYESIIHKKNIAIEFEQLEKRKYELEQDVAYLERKNKALEKNGEHLKRLTEEAKNGFENTLTQLATTKMNNDIIDFLLNIIPNRQMLEVPKNVSIPNQKILQNIEADEIIDIFEKNLNSVAKRNMAREDIINILISVTQNFITVFAGEPGVGKTSLCTILGKSLGLYDERFVKIPVERGWTSRKDLIGYYNPLSKTVEKTNIEFFNSLSKITNEANRGINNIPFFILLDEANLSPIEHYWANFISISDAPTSQDIVLGEDIKFHLTDAC